MIAMRKAGQSLRGNMGRLGRGEDPTRQDAASPRGASLWLHPGTRAQERQGFIVHFLKNKIRNKILLWKASLQLLGEAVNISGSS